MTTSAPVAPTSRLADWARTLPPVPPLPGWQLVLGGGVGLLVGVLSGRPFLAVLGAAGIPYALVTSLRTKIVGYFVMLPLVGGLRFQFADSPMEAIPGLMAVAVLVHLTLLVLTNRIRLPIRHPLAMLAFAYALIAAAQAFTPLAREFGVGFAGARSFLEPFVFFLAGLVFWGDRDAPRLFFRLSVIVALVVGLIMLRQLVFGFSAAEVAFQGRRLNFSIVNEQKLFSTFTGPSLYAFVTTMLTIICLAARYAGETPKRLTVLAGMLGAVGIVASGVRVALVGAVVAIPMMLFLIGTSPGGRRYARRAGAVVLCVAIALGAIIAVTPVQERRAANEAGNPVSAAIIKLALFKAGTGDEDVNVRQQRVGQFTNYMRRHPWGAGAGAVAIVVDAGAPQAGALRLEPRLPPLLRNETWIFKAEFYYFSVGVELGLIALILFIAILLGGVFFSLGERAVERDRARRMVLCVAASTIVFAMIHNVSNEAFRVPQMSSYVWFLLSVPVAFAATRTRDAEDALSAETPTSVRGRARRSRQDA